MWRGCTGGWMILGGVLINYQIGLTVKMSFRESDMDQITVFFDMEDSGMSNLDMDYTRYIINLFKLYYPNSCNYILVYELPWVLTGEFTFESW